MHLTLAHAGSCDPAGRLSFSWSIDADDGTRLAEQAGTVEGYPAAGRRPHTAHLEGLLAALEWLQPLAWVKVEELTVLPATPQIRADVTRADLPDEDTPLTRVVAHLAYFRRKGVLVEVRREVVTAGKARKPRLAPRHGRECDVPR